MRGQICCPRDLCKILVKLVSTVLSSGKKIHQKSPRTEDGIEPLSRKGPLDLKSSPNTSQAHQCTENYAKCIINSKKFSEIFLCSLFVVFWSLSLRIYLSIYLSITRAFFSACEHDVSMCACVRPRCSQSVRKLWFGDIQVQFDEELVDAFPVGLTWPSAPRKFVKLEPGNGRGRAECFLIPSRFGSWKRPTTPILENWHRCWLAHTFRWLTSRWHQHSTTQQPGRKKFKPNILAHPVNGSQLNSTTDTVEQILTGQRLGRDAARLWVYSNRYSPRQILWKIRGIY